MIGNLQFMNKNFDYFVPIAIQLADKRRGRANLALASSLSNVFFSILYIYITNYNAVCILDQDLVLLPLLHYILVMYHYY